MRSTIKVTRQEKCQVAELLSGPKRATSANYAKKNYEMLKKKQEENRDRKEKENNRPVKEPFKMKRFQNVQSAFQKTSDSFRKTCDDTRKPTKQLQVDDSRDFVRNNAVNAISALPPKPKEKIQHSVHSLNPNYGKIPGYLEEYKNKRNEEIELLRAKEEASKLPKGMRLVDDHERLETLEHLRNGKEEVFQAINKLPIANVTAAVRKRKNELEEKLREIEQAISTFSRPKVYVAI